MLPKSAVVIEMNSNFGISGIDRALTIFENNLKCTRAYCRLKLTLFSTKNRASCGHFSDERVSGVLSAYLDDVDRDPTLHHYRNGRLELFLNATCVRVSLLVRRFYLLQIPTYRLLVTNLFP